MTKLPNKSFCTGCGACEAICPTGAITMQPDNEGFQQPTISRNKCVDCGQCEAVCPVLKNLSMREPLQVLATAAADKHLRYQSSSGGVFGLLAQSWQQDNGWVAGTTWSAEWELIHQVLSPAEDVAILYGSKYLQSRTQGIMSAIGKLLQEDERVLFCGTPCQVAALLSFLKETNPTPHWHQQLLCLDFICHGVPSPEVFKQYRLEISRKYQAELEKISFRDKNAGWNNYSVCFTFADGSCYRQLSNDNQYMQGFLSELYNRPSCHQCQFRHLRSGADLTLGDYWGVEKTFPELNDDLGTSVMMINTNEGKEVWGKICDQVKFACESTFADVVAKNSALVDNPAIHNKRNAFFKKLNSSHSVTQLIQSCLRPGKIDQMKNIARRQKQRARKILNIIKRLIIQNE